MTASLYADGGLVGRNPSKKGGTWAWCLIEKDLLLSKGSGLVTPEDIGVEECTNNQMEMLAVLEALQSNQDFQGGLYTDSLVTLRRMKRSMSFKGLPLWMREKCLSLRRNALWEIFLLKGHPSKKDLERGANGTGTPVSRWNAFCDHECTKLAKNFLGTS